MKERTKDTSKIMPSGKKYTILDYLRIPLMSCPVCTIIIGINRIVDAFVPAITTLITAYFVDTAVAIFQGIKPQDSIWMPIILIMLLIIYRNLSFTLIYGFVNIRYDMAIYHNVRAALADKRGKLKYEHIENNETWNLISRACDDSLAGIAIGMNNVFDMLELIINVTSVIIIIMTQVWWVGLAVLAAAIPLMIVAMKGGKKSYQTIRETRKYFRRSNYYHEVLTKRDYVEERSLFGYCKGINDKWFEQYEKNRKHNLKVTLEIAIKTRLSAFSTLAVSAVVVTVLILMTVNGNMSIGLFTGLTTTALSLVNTMSWYLAYVARTFAEKQEYLNDLTAFMALSEQEGAFDLPQNASELQFERIEFKNVSFKYPDTDKYILKDFNLVLEKNLHYAFVGINGAGKTTITKLLTGMYDNYEGEILINGKNLRQYHLSELKGLFTVVYQDFAKFQVTAGDNIMMGNVRKLEQRHDMLNEKGLTDTASEKEMQEQGIEKYDRETIEDILKEIDLFSAIEKLSEGMDTNLGKIDEDGVDMSGGQWQRIAVARALFNPALVRILDEPTAALDPVAESNIYKMFGRISAGKTTIFITHRLGAAKLADEIIVIDDGKVAEKGNHNMLMKLDGIYASMFESQKSWYQSEEGGVCHE